MNVDFKITPKQYEVLNSESEITLFSAGRGCGKTAIMSLISIFNIVKNKRVLVIGPTYRQIKDSNYRQTCIFLDQMKVACKRIGSELRIKVGKNGELIHISGEEPESIRSYTSIDVLIFDEAASLSEECWKLAIATMRNTSDGKQKIFIVGTPPADESHWVVRQSNKPDVKLIFGSYKDNPFNGENFEKMIEREYEHYPYDFRRRELFGEFRFSNDGGRLFDDFRLEKDNAYIVKKDVPIVCGLDIAGTGRDLTCAVVSQNCHVLGIYMRKTANEEELKKLTRELHIIHGFNVLRYDSTGLGHLLVFDLPQSVAITPVNFGAEGGDRFINARTAMYFYLRRKNGIFANEEIFNEHSEALLAELRATLIKEKENKKIGVIPKEAIKNKIGRSPDRADALVLSVSHVEAKRGKPHIAPLVFGR